MAPRVLYMGYGAVGCGCLADLVAAGFEVVGVFCRAADRAERPAGAGSLFTQAGSLGLPRFGALDPNDPAFVEEARGLAPDLLISVQYDSILKPPLLAVPRHGPFNLHFGPLPRLRGCFPTKWAILEDEPAGVTFHWIDPGVDSGDVVDQVLVPLAPGETDETLYRRLERAGRELFAAQIPWMRDLAPPPRRPQDPAAASYHPKALPFGGVIDWSRDAAWVERLIRAYTFPPYPAAKTWHRGEELQIRAPVAFGAGLPEAADLAPGSFVPRQGDAIEVACGEGSLLVGRVIAGGVERPAAELAAARAGVPWRFESAP